MDRLQLLLASMLILIICLIVWFNNSINKVRQPRMLKYIGLLAVIVSIYFYSNLESQHMDCIWGVAGGEYTGGDNGGHTDDNIESLIVELPQIQI